MFRTLLLGLSIAATSGLIVSTAAVAQTNDASTLSADELEDLFKKQKTRGLVLAPTGTGDNTAATETSPSATTEVTAVETAAQEEYVELAPEEQVQIQITFDFDSAALREDQKPKLTTLCSVMQSGSIQVFKIVGHTDTSGSASYNERLSLLRAEEVKRFLIGDCGIDAARLQAVGVGEAFPLDKENPRGDVNRRVEFQALS